ncbi:MAG TPA: hypothetical protein VF868_11540 [Bacteroidia bacterium]|jgi:dienelactone hydrolase
MEYRITSGGRISWNWVNAKPEKKPDGTVVWYGTFQDVTAKKEHLQLLEKILFDISHVMRRLVATLLGLTNAIESTELKKAELKEYTGHLHTVAREMDEYLKKLNTAYLGIKPGHNYRNLSQ